MKPKLPRENKCSLLYPNSMVQKKTDKEEKSSSNAHTLSTCCVPGPILRTLPGSGIYSSQRPGEASISTIPSAELVTVSLSFLIRKWG